MAWIASSAMRIALSPAAGRARQGGQCRARARRARTGGAARAPSSWRSRSWPSSAFIRSVRRPADPRRARRDGARVRPPICFAPGRARARRRRRAEPVRARRRARLRLLAGHRRGRHAARPHADDPHHRLSLLPRAGLLHARRHRRAGLRTTRGRDRRGHLLRPALSRNTCARSRSAAPISSSCRRPARSTSGRRASTKRRCGSPRFRTATSSRCATASAREECLTFAGESFVCAPDGRVIARAAAARGLRPRCRHRSARDGRVARAPAVPAASPAGALRRGVGACGATSRA